MSVTQQVVLVAMGVAATMLTRFIPFLVFRPDRPTPKYIVYLGRVLPASVYALLVVYCLREVCSVDRGADGGWALLFSSNALAQLLSVAFTFAMHVWRRNLMWSIAGGTACYMVLVRLL